MKKILRRKKEEEILYQDATKFCILAFRSFRFWSDIFPRFDFMSSQDIVDNLNNLITQSGVRSLFSSSDLIYISNGHH